MSKTWWSKECAIKYYTIQYNRYAISMRVKTLHMRKKLAISHSFDTRIQYLIYGIYYLKYSLLYKV